MKKNIERKIKINKDILDEIEKITFTFYPEDRMLDEYEVNDVMEELLSYYKHLEEEFDDFKRDVEENYRRLRIEEQL